MSKSIKFKNNNYLDSSSIVHNKVILKNYLDKSEYTISNTPAHSAGTNSYMLNKVGNQVVLVIDNIFINSITKDIWNNLGTLPVKIAPSKNISCPCVVPLGSTGAVASYGKICIGPDGVIRCKIKDTISELCSILFNIVWTI